MTKDSQKGTVAYNHLGLTKSVTEGTDVLKYTYDATGCRIKKQLNNVASRWYMATRGSGHTRKFKNINELILLVDKMYIHIYGM
ncbi:MAG: hypothetical protein LBL24_10645 [Bacteroidales bacterium]|jgi:YD repeat-containing protein|nr:hypothetical protein [Bacteroidales bacterium]